MHTHTDTTEIFKSYRCPGCNKLLFKGSLVISTVQVKCRKCGLLATFNCLDDVVDEERFSLLADSQGTVITMGMYKKDFCGPQQSLVGTKLPTLLLLMGSPEQYDRILKSLEQPDFAKTYRDTIGSPKSPLTVQWHFIRREGLVYIYVLFDRRAPAPAKATTVDEIAENAMLPTIMRTASLA